MLQESVNRVAQVGPKALAFALLPAAVGCQRDGRRKLQVHQIECECWTTTGVHVSSKPVAGSGTHD